MTWLTTAQLLAWLNNRSCAICKGKALYFADPQMPAYCDEHYPYKEFMDEEIDKIERTRRNIKRGGNVMPTTMAFSIKDYRLSANDALLLFNTYGIGLETILLIAHSHNLTVDEIGFNKLLDEQIERSKGMKQCQQNAILKK